MSLVARTEAQEAGLTRYFTGRPCVRGHVSERRVSSKSCCECSNAATKRWREKYPDRSKRKVSSWRSKNPKRVKAYSRDKYARNRDYYIVSAAQRKKHVKQATPSWADTQAIKSVYERARCLSRETGVTHHVDHIIPLRGGTVCGLHVVENLRVVTAQENLQKGNRLTEDV